MTHIELCVEDPLSVAIATDQDEVARIVTAVRNAS